MKIEIDILNLENSKKCKFGRNCLEDFTNSMCCDIQGTKDDVLTVSPVSTFKSSTCPFLEQISQSEKQIHICSCPVRKEIYEKYRK